MEKAWSTVSEGIVREPYATDEPFMMGTFCDTAASIEGISFQFHCEDETI